MNDNDVMNFKSQINIEFPVYIESGDILDKWNDVINKYSADAVSSIVLIAKENGDILDYYFGGCDCEEAFINKLIGMSSKGE